MHLLLTIDFSETSRSAVPEAAALARKLGAKITLLHVVPNTLLVPVADLGVPPRTPRIWSQQWSNAEHRLAEVRPLLGDDLIVDTVVIDGENVAHTIATWARDHHADAIMMACHGRSGISRIAFGSVAEEVLRVSTTPVFLIPPRG